MNDMIKVISLSDKDKAGIAGEKLKLKGYTVNTHETQQVLLDATALGNHKLILSDPNETVYVVIGIRPSPLD